MNFNRICLRCMNGEILANGICSVCGKPPVTEQSIAHALPIRTIINDRYFIGIALNQGESGITYTAYDMKENRRTAVKEFFPSSVVHRAAGTTRVEATDDELFLQYREHFLKEAQLVRSLRSVPEIVDIYNVFTENGTGYYSMEFLTGQTLRDYVKTAGGKLTWAQMIPIVKDTVKALEILHKQGSIHGSICPDNIFLSTNGKAKLIGFGAAGQDGSENDTAPFFKEGFAPPEQCLNDGNPGPWTDIYAFSASVYFCVTGQMIPDAAARAAMDLLRKPRSLGAVIPPFAETALIKALSVRPEARYQDIESFARDLHLANGTQPVPAAEKWRLRGIRGRYANLKIPFSSNIIIGRDPSRCTLVYPPNVPGISRIHITLLYGTGPSFPGFRCESSFYPVYINGMMYNKAGQIGRLQSGDRISLGNDEIFVIEKTE